MVVTGRIAIAALLFFLVGEPTDDFTPPNLDKAVFMACMVSGVQDAPPYAEAQVLVRYGNTRVGEWKPILSRRTLQEGGVPRAIEDCREWLDMVKHKIEKAVKEAHAPAATPQDNVPQLEGRIPDAR